MKYLYLTATSIILAYLLVNLFVYFYQRNLLYNPSENNYLNDKINFDYQEIFIETDKNIKLKSWFINKDLKRFKTLVFFHGNAGNLLNRVHKLNELSKLDLNILLISWRSFSGNKGKPTEENLYYVLPISLSDASLGTTVEVPSIDGGKSKIKIPAGTQHGKQFRLKGKGMPILRRTLFGDLYIRVVTQVPTSLSKRQKEILEEFNELEANKPDPVIKNFFEKAKKFWKSS